MLFILPSVPPSDVELSLRPEPFYAGTTLTLTCTVSVDPNVNNNEKVVIKWTPAQGGRISVDTTVRVSNSSYESSLTINPLAKEDSGIFVCMGIIIGGSSSATDTSNISIEVIGEYSKLASTYVLLRDFIFLDLPDPNVTLSSTTVGLAGEEEKLICTMTTVEYLSESAIVNLTWSGGSVGSSGVTESGTVNVSETTSISNLTFSSLSTLHGAKYSCQAVIEIPAIFVTKTGTESTDLIVKSKNAILYEFTVIFVFFLVPSPLVTVHTNEKELVSGSSLFLSCSITPFPVDTPITLLSNWTSPNTSIVQNEVNDTSVDFNITDVETADSGDYICSSTINDSTSSMYILNSDPGTNSTTIIVSKYSALS